jgi:hypothetical protein
MKIDFSAVLMDLNGKPLLAPDNDAVQAAGLPPPSKPLTLAAASVEALLATTRESAQDPGDVKLRCYTLAQQINAGGTVDLDPGDAAFIKTKIAAVYSPAVVGPAFALLNG